MVANKRPSVPSWQFKGSKKYTAPYVHTLFPRVPVSDICVCNIYNIVEFGILQKLPANLCPTLYGMHYQLFMNQLSKSNNLLIQLLKKLLKIRERGREGDGRESTSLRSL